MKGAFSLLSIEGSLKGHDIQEMNGVESRNICNCESLYLGKQAKFVNIVSTKLIQTVVV